MGLICVHVTINTFVKVFKYEASERINNNIITFMTKSVKFKTINKIVGKGGGAKNWVTCVKVKVRLVMKYIHTHFLLRHQ